MGILCMIGTTEIIVVCILALLLFGGKKIPELMKGLGQGMRSFKSAMNEPLPEERQQYERSRHQQQNQEDLMQQNQPTRNESEQG